MIQKILYNPFYAGAYVYGRTETRVFYEDGRIKKTAGHYRKPEDWDVFIKDHHEGYISFEQYEKNVLQMKNNSHTHKADESVGAVRAGKAILVGLVRCGRCGRKMHVRYWGKGGLNPRYEVNRAFTQYNAVDPLNRLVVTELEKQWDEKLAALEEISTVRSLCERLPEVWGHPQTDPTIKKQIVRLMVEEVIIRLDESEPMLTMTIHWKGGIHTRTRFKKPTKGDPPSFKTEENVISLVQKLAPHHADEEIARKRLDAGSSQGVACQKQNCTFR